jgi:hypothetical protein
VQQQLPECCLLHAAETFLAIHGDDLGHRQARSISLLSSTKLQPISSASNLPRVDLPAPRRPIRAMPAKTICRCVELPLPCPDTLGPPQSAVSSIQRVMATRRGLLPTWRGFGFQFLEFCAMFNE